MELNEGTDHLVPFLFRIVIFLTNQPFTDKGKSFFPGPDFHSDVIATILFSHLGNERLIAQTSLGLEIKGFNLQGIVNRTQALAVDSACNQAV